MFAYYLLICCVIVSQSKPLSIPGVLPMSKETIDAFIVDDGNLTASCSDFSWFPCQPGYGIIYTSTNYPKCCGDNVYFYCPNGYMECTSSSGCCPNGYQYHCNYGGKSFCCPEEYPICGDNMQCLSGTCHCQGCPGVDPCQFTGCDAGGCSGCCNAYSSVCPSGWTCTSDNGIIGTQNIMANSTCCSC